MNNNQGFFPAKIMLFGEYTLMQGSAALAVPFDDYGAELRFPMHKGESETAGSNRQLSEFYDYLRSSHLEGMDYNSILDLGSLEHDIRNGMFLYSNIPRGQGLGSSGALVAAVWAKYALKLNKTGHGLKVEDIFFLRRVFSNMEGFFHGSSSGIDPITSFTRRPVMFSGKTPLAAEIAMGFSTNTGRSAFFLIGSRLPRKTSRLIRLYKEKLGDKAFRSAIENAYIPVCNECISDLLKGSSELEGHFKKLSGLQYELFREMIPDKLRPLWKSGLDQGTFSLKLCGAGGGGFFLGYGNDPITVSGLGSSPGMDVRLINKSF